MFTHTERILWHELCGRRLAGLKFRRQYPVGPYIVDFFCAEKKLVIEIDGDSHVDDLEREAIRTEWLENQGFRVMRFTNREVNKLMTSVLDVIKE
ncbi:MAG TPA: endonuclease domain-containing protein [Anaerolineae bacterium]|nr:endonuclease domain-containing protein [Anaerolineae bacterium]